MLSPFALSIVDGQSPVADHAGEGDPLVSADVKAVAADSLPGEIASDAEPADVATQKKFVADVKA